jgi:hypothetical protein
VSTLPDGKMKITFHSAEAFRTYQLESRADLNPGTAWVAIPNQIVLSTKVNQALEFLVFLPRQLPK